MIAYWARTVSGISNDATDSTMNSEEMLRRQYATASTVDNRVNIPHDIELALPIEKKRGKYWESPKFKFGKDKVK